LRGAELCDEIVNSVLMEIATDRMARLLRFGGGEREFWLEISSLQVEQSSDESRNSRS